MISVEPVCKVVIGKIGSEKIIPLAGLCTESKTLVIHTQKV